MKKTWIIFSILFGIIALTIALLVGIALGVSSGDGVGFENDSIAAWISALSTLAIALLTIFLAKETWELRTAQNLQIESIRRSSIRPNVQVVLKETIVGIHFVNIHISNKGNGPAYDVKFSFKNLNPSTSDVYEKLLSRTEELSMLKDGIRIFPQGDERKTFFISFLDLNSTFGDRTFESGMEITIEFNDSEGHKYKTISSLDFKEFKGMEQLGADPLYKISQLFEKLERKISGVISNNRIKANVYTSEDRQREDEISRRNLEELRKKNES